MRLSPAGARGERRKFVVKQTALVVISWEVAQGVLETQTLAILNGAAHTRILSSFRSLSLGRDKEG